MKANLPHIPLLVGNLFTSEPKSLCPGKLVAGTKTCGQHQRRLPRVSALQPGSKGKQPPPGKAMGGRCQHSCPEVGGRPERGPCGWEAALCQCRTKAEGKGFTQADVCIVLAYQPQEDRTASILAHHPAKSAGKTKKKTILWS